MKFEMAEVKVINLDTVDVISASTVCDADGVCNAFDPNLGGLDYYRTYLTQKGMLLHPFLRCIYINTYSFP